MNKFVFGAAVAALSLGTSGTAMAQRNNAPAVLVVDVQRISSECTACRAAQTQLQTQLNEFQQRRTTLGQQINTEGQPLQQAVNALNGKEPDANLQQRLRTFEQRQQQAAQELQTRGAQIESTEAHVNKQIFDRLVPILESIRANRNAGIVVARNSVFAANPTLDVTNDALAELNRQLPSVSVTPMPQPAQAAQPQQPQGR